MDFRPIKLQSVSNEMGCSKYYSEVPCFPFEVQRLSLPKITNHEKVQILLSKYHSLYVTYWKC